MPTTSFERLSTELFLDVFEYLNAVDLVRAFRDLNSRFNGLLFGLFRAYRLDLRSISKVDFQVLCQTSLPLIRDRTIYLRLSDDDDTPSQCAHLLASGFTLDRFVNLRALICRCVDADEQLDHTFFAGLHRLVHLRYLKFVDCYLEKVNGDEPQALVDRIWGLPQLTHLHWQVRSDGWCSPRVVSKSLQYLTVLGRTWSANQFGRLFKKTPRLYKFHTAMNTYEEDDLPPFQAFIPKPAHLSLRKLILSEVRSRRELTNLFTLVTHVKYLHIHVITLQFDGRDWEEMIRRYLPQLEVFQMTMDTSLPRTANAQDDESIVDRYMHTYTSPFWIDRQWFIRCHWTVRRGGELSIKLYTLPYALDYFSTFTDDFNFRTKSTCPGHLFFNYDALRNIPYESWIFDDEAFSGVQIKNIRVVSVALPTDRRFFTVFPQLQNVVALCVNISSTQPPSQLQELLDRMPRLFSLTFESCSTRAMPPYALKSDSVRRIDLRHHNYNKEQCEELSQSPLGQRCRVLFIEVEHAVSILTLIHCMANLRTLEVDFQGDDKRNKVNLLETLREHLPPTWTITRLCYGHFIAHS